MHYFSAYHMDFKKTNSLIKHQAIAVILKKQEKNSP